MGIIALTLKIMPNGPDTDIALIKDQVGKKLSEKYDIKDIREFNIGFGLKSIEILLTFSDKTGSTDEIENTLRSIPGVASVEQEDMTLL